jgi:hypothetical protein
MIHRLAGVLPMCRLRLAICFALALVWTVGCSGRTGPPPTAAVKGTINMDGKPLPTGELHFGVHGAPPSVLKVKDGAFSGQAPIGQNKVELFILTDGPPSQKYQGPGAASKINTAPGKYWGPNTALDAAVGATGSNEFKFDISSR